MSHVELQPREEPYASAFVWGLWGLFLCIALWFVNTYGIRIPLLEDWFFVDLLTGKQDLTPAWLWEQERRTGHRGVLIKLLFYLDLYGFGVNVRPLLFMNVALFGALSAGLIVAAKRLRGTTCYADAFFPILLLSLGQSGAFLWAQSTVYITTTTLAGAILIAIVGTRTTLKPLSAVAAGTSLTMLPLCFGGGVAFAPFLGLWLTWAGYQLFREPGVGRRFLGGLCLTFVLAAALIVVAYMVGDKPAPFDGNEEPTASSRLPIAAAAKASLKYLAMGLGPAARPPIWPVSGLVVVGLCAVSAVALGGTLRRRPASWGGPAPGVAFYLLACLLVAAGVGWSRASWGSSYLFEHRYPASAVPLLLGVFFAWEVGLPARFRPLGRTVLLALSLSTLSQNTAIALWEVPWRTPDARAYEKDLRDGISIPRMVSKYAGITHHDHEKIESYLRNLRDAKVGNYQRLFPDPVFKKVNLPLTPVELNQVEWDGKAGRATGTKPFLTFDLGETQFVCGLLIKYSNKNPGGFNPIFKVATRDKHAGQSFAEDPYLHIDVPTGGQEVDVPVWLYETIDQVRVQPDKRPCDFTISEITLLLPTTDAERIPTSNFDLYKRRR